MAEGLTPGGQLLLDAIRTGTSDEVLNKIQKVCSKSSSHTIGNTTKGEGFTNLNISQAAAVYPKMKIEKLERLLPTFLDDCPEAIKADLAKVVKRICIAEVGMEHRFKFDFNNNKGQLAHLYLSVESVDDNRCTVKYFEMASQFALAPNSYIVSHSKKNWLTSKSWDEIVYVPRGIEQTDIASIYQILGATTGAIEQQAARMLQN